MSMPFLYLLLLLMAVPIQADDYTDSLPASYDESKIGRIFGELSRLYKKQHNVALADIYKEMALQAGDQDTLLLSACECAKNGDRAKARHYLTTLVDLEKSMEDSMEGSIGSLTLMLLDNDVERAIGYVCIKGETDDFFRTEGMSLMAHIFLLMGNYDEAEQWYLRVISWKMGSTPYIDLARFYRKRGDLKKALCHYLTAGQNQEEHGVLYQIAKIYYAQGRFDFAQMALESPFAVDDHRITPYLALVYCAQGKSEACKRLLNQVNIEIPSVVNPETVKAAIKKHWQLTDEVRLLKELATASMHTKRFDQALPHFLRIIELGKGDDEILMALAKTYRKLGKFDQAETIYKTDRLYSAETGTALYGLGKIAEHKKLYSQAETYYQGALERPLSAGTKILPSLIRVCNILGKSDLAGYYQEELRRIILHKSYGYTA
jgi:tetratricopeptide (TPR) repeat protein